MVRRSTRKSAGSAPTSSAKRPASSSGPGPLKQAKAAKASHRKTPAKSSYFSAEDEDEEKSDAESEALEESGYEDEDEDASKTSETESEAFPSGSDDEPPKRKGRSLKAKPAVPSKSFTSMEAQDPDVTTEPSGRVIIKKPKPREAGSTPYKDETIHPNTVLFLKDLAANNNRPWLKLHDADYRTSLNDSNSFFEQLTAKIIEKDETVPELPVKDIIFRIYRDVRFSSDPTPYKTHFSAAWSRTGRKGPYAGYYVQISPTRSLVGT
ncbi:hypothetical protein K402DRAFT_128393 [Aulographum hederae CBS 113979]|uniref:Uncharacterized protein n=1 Tax=Aulographum hederae CBS 113979 TaxID=1176131 RepID=A0A6G1HEH7_9PEZI|nr:hypothetical protein K402DRAFT_128393 [Aulographum hederae CBS 113979]